MSVIQDALRKVQYTPEQVIARKTKKDNDGLEIFGSGMISESLLSRPSNKVAQAKKLYLPLLLASVAIIIAVIIATLLYFNFAHRNVTAKKVIVKTSIPLPANMVNVDRPEQKTVAVVSDPINTARDIATIVVQSPDFVLNGIMYLETGPRAIINDSVVEEGDTINGAKVTSIKRQSVTLDDKGKEIDLRLR